MARFQTLSRQRIAELTTRRARPVAVDLTEYKQWVERAKLESDGWGEIQLEPTGNVRAIKRRTTIAGKELGLKVRWKPTLASGTLLFQVIAAGSSQRRIRRKQTP
jgi:hypothetical protein